MHWRIDHEFQELVGKKALQPAKLKEGYFVKVSQFINFKMDRKGVKLSSGVQQDWNDGDEPELERFIFDRPFLITLQKRGSRQPFFVMWVDNAELLQKT